jgi:glycosyltransferase involved in cell wall biosynthesis
MLAAMPDSPAAERPALHQLVPVLSSGDAISHHVRWIQSCLTELGYHSEIYTEGAVVGLADQVRLLADGPIPANAGLIYHHCVGTALAQMVARHKGPKTLIYHNITPPEYFEPFNPALAEILHDGRNSLPGMADDFSLAFGDSHFSALELKHAGFENCGIMPIPVFLDRWNEPPDPEILAQLSDGLRKILCVGRVAPHKCTHHLVEAFYHYLCMDPKARLIISGVAEPQDPYVALVQDRIDRLGLRPRVLLYGHVPDAKLHALYRSADLLWSMSEHEGFCIALLEAMWFDIPVLAYKSTAIPEILGEGGMIFDSKSDLRKVAALAKCVIHDQCLKEQVLRAQTSRRQDFLPERIAPMIQALAERLMPMQTLA